MVKEKKITAITGKDIDIQADSVCVHGDGAKALAFVEKIREAFAKEPRYAKGRPYDEGIVMEDGAGPPADGIWAPEGRKENRKG